MRLHQLRWDSPTEAVATNTVEFVLPPFCKCLTADNDDAAADAATAASFEAELLEELAAQLDKEDDMDNGADDAADDPASAEIAAMDAFNDMMQQSEVQRALEKLSHSVELQEKFRSRSRQAASSPPSSSSASSSSSTSIPRAEETAAAACPDVQDEENLNELLDLAADLSDGDGDYNQEVADQPVSRGCASLVSVSADAAANFLSEWSHAAVSNSAAAVCSRALLRGTVLEDAAVEAVEGVVGAGDVSMCSLATKDGGPVEDIDEAEQLLSEIVFVHWDVPSMRLGRICRLVGEL